MDINKLILEKIHDKGSIKSSEIVKITGFSRVYVNRFFRELKDEGKITLIGKANRAHYVIADKGVVLRERKGILEVNRVFKNASLAEDLVLEEIKKNSGIFAEIPKNIQDILQYAFSEMLNNAIEHSKSELIKIKMRRDKTHVLFDVIDEGMGIFNNIMRKKELNDEWQAIQNLLKGKETTAPHAHSGEGIFFTSKTADIFIIRSSRKKVIFDNILNDIFIKDGKYITGTRVKFSVRIDSLRQLDDIFRQYADSSFEFSKTSVKVKLYKMGSEYISRSQARRIVSGLEKFKTVILDFQDVQTVGQAFADEIFRIWQFNHPAVSISTINVNENIEFMINRAKSGLTSPGRMKTGGN